jgi:hypothetical protein
MNDDDILNHLIDIKDRLGSIETLSTGLKDDLKTHVAQSRETRGRVEDIEKEVAQAKGSIKTIKWVFGVPAILLAVIEAAKLLINHG